MKKILMTIEPQNAAVKLNNNLAIYLQGAIMERIDTKYAEKLHHYNVNPYSSSVYSDNGSHIWEVNTLNDEAESNLYSLLISDNFNDVKITALGNETINITNKITSELTQADMADIFYRNSRTKEITLSFITPTAFKQRGRYINYPDIRLLLQAVLLKYNGIYEQGEEINEDFLEQLIDNVTITRYQLKTHPFRIHRVPIIGFNGTLTMKLTGNETITNYISMLCYFAEYSGIGIKSSMGMGKVKIVEEVLKGSGRIG